MKWKTVTITAIAGVVFVLSNGCKKSADTPYRPVVTTKQVTSINSTSVVSGGYLANVSNITDEGIIYGTDSTTLTISSVNKISNGAGQPDFIDSIQNLLPNTTYYVKAYAVNSSGSGYGAAVQFTTSHTVYVAGYDGSFAAYWKDGKETILPTPANNGWAHSIYVTGNDVYAAGEYNGSTNIVAVYWKNGKLVSLSDGSTTAVAYSIIVTGNDVYVAGYELNGNWPVAKYWKNGVAVALTGGTIDNNGIAYSMYVAGSDVYVSGFRGNETMGYQIATYWKNGIAVALLDSNNAVGVGQSVFVQGNDVYVAGNEKAGIQVGGIPVAKYWKNGKSVVLTDGSQFAGAYAICVNGSNVYTAGYEYSGVTGYSVAKYWKNGNAVGLTDGTTYGNAYSINAVNNDVYVAGGEDYYFDAKYWKNATALPLALGPGYSRASAIFVQ